MTSIFPCLKKSIEILSPLWYVSIFFFAKAGKFTSSIFIPAKSNIMSPPITSSMSLMVTGIVPT